MEGLGQTDAPPCAGARDETMKPVVGDVVLYAGAYPAIVTGVYERAPETAEEAEIEECSTRVDVIVARYSWSTADQFFPKYQVDFAIGAFQRGWAHIWTWPRP